MENCVCMWYLGKRRSCFRKNLRDLGCHFALGRGHLLLPLRDKIPAEIQPRISSDECAIYRAICDSSGRNKIHSWIASTSDHRAPETDSTDTESLHGMDEQEKTPCDEARDYLENRKGRWVRVHCIARRTLVDPMQDAQPFLP